MKKHFLLLLVLSVLIIPTKLLAYTVNQIITINGNTYKVLQDDDNGAYLCLIGTNAVGEFEVPSIVKDGIDKIFTVTEVGGDENCKSSGVKSIILPPTIKKINYGAFNDANVESMYIPESVEYINHSAYYKWIKAPVFTVAENNPYFSNGSDGALYNKDKTELYCVPSDVSLSAGAYTVNESVKKIYFNAFLKNNNLKKIVLPKDLYYIEEGFPTITYGCDKLEEFDIAPDGDTEFWVKDGVLFRKDALMNYPRGKTDESYKVPDKISVIIKYAIQTNGKMRTIDLNNVEKLNDCSLINCGSLKTVTIPKNLDDEGVEGAIVSCNAITSYVVPDDCVNFSGKDGVVFSKNMKKLYFYPPSKPGTTYNIPDEVESIERYAFRSCKFIETLNIPGKISNIGQQAFRDMRELRNVKFEEPSSVETFGNNIFMECRYLTEVTLPKSLIKIASAFYRCAALKTINVPDGSKLKEIDGSAFITNTALENFNFIGRCELTTIGSNAFANLQGITSFDVPKTVTQISANAFSGCSNLAKVTFAEDALIKKILAGAFANCGLNSITIPESVTTIENEAFRNCQVLTVVNLSKQIQTIDPGAFKNCSQLTDINVDKDNTKYSSVDGYLLTHDKKTLVIFPPGKANDKFTLLPPSITKIGDYSFYDCKELKNVIIPNKVTSIGARAFGLCTNLKTVTFLCDEFIDPSNIDQGQNTMSFDDGVIAQFNMFGNMDIYVRKNLLDAFRSDPYYQNFKVVGTSFSKEGNEYMPVSDNSVDLLAVGNTDYTFVVPTKVRGSVAIDNQGHHEEREYDVKLIGDYAFQNTTNAVKEVVIKNNVEYIGAKAFMTNINNLTSTIENIFFIESNPTKRMLSTVRFELDETNYNYNEFASTTKIYVKKSACETYKDVWHKMVYKPNVGYQESQYNFVNQIDYRIPDVSIKTKYGTFAREFDTDFSDYFTTSGKSEVAAFVAGSPIKVGNGDYGTSTHKVTMTSIDENGGVEGNYGYIPAYTGVLLKVLDKVATDGDFYYTIGEKDDVSYDITNNIMNECTVNYKEVLASEDDPIYVMQGGVFRKATATITKFPVHRAYMKPGTIGAGAKIMFVFDDEETVTSLDEIIASDVRKENNEYYNLNGQRVENPQQGIYIKNGKKVVIK